MGDTDERGQEAFESKPSLTEMVKEGAIPYLVDRDGRKHALPKEVAEMVVAALASVEKNEQVALVTKGEALTTQAAANFLNVSRQFFVRLLDQGEIPFHRVGTHRRVYMTDLAEYKAKRSEFRKKLLDQMTEEAVAAGLDDIWVDLARP